jgi:hypothetical protein
VRRDGAVIDPFAPDGAVTCPSGGGPAGETLWADPPDYLPGGFMAAGFADAVPPYEAILGGTAGSDGLSGTSPALVVWGFAFGGQKGDVIDLTIIGPDGAAVTDHRVVLDRDQAQFVRAAGRKLRGAEWPPGRYRGELALIRDGEAVDVTAATVTIE